MENLQRLEERAEAISRGGGGGRPAACSAKRKRFFSPYALSRSSRGGRKNQLTVGQMAKSQKIDSSTVSMIVYKHIAEQFDSGELLIFKRAFVKKPLRADS